MQKKEKLKGEKKRKRKENVAFFPAIVLLLFSFAHIDGCRGKEMGKGGKNREGEKKYYIVHLFFLFFLFTFQCEINWLENLKKEEKKMIELFYTAVYFLFSPSPFLFRYIYLFCQSIDLFICLFWSFFLLFCFVNFSNYISHRFFATDEWIFIVWKVVFDWWYCCKIITVLDNQQMCCCYCSLVLCCCEKKKKKWKFCLFFWESARKRPENWGKKWWDWCGGVVAGELRTEWMARSGRTETGVGGRGGIDCWNSIAFIL